MDIPNSHVVSGPDALRRVGEFRYGIYVEEQGKNATYVDHQARTLIEPADHRATSTIFWIERDQQLVGTLRTEVLTPDHDEITQLQLDALNFIETNRIVYCTRLMVAREARHSDVTSNLFRLGVTLALLKEWHAGVLTCRPALVPLFRQFGCTQYAHAFVHPERGPQVPMAILPEAEYLRRRGAPLADWLACHRPESPHTPQFLQRTAGFSHTPRLRERTARRLVA